MKLINNYQEFINEEYSKNDPIPEINRMKEKLGIVLLGLPGSGKSTFANKFIVQGTTDTGLTGAQFLGALGTGLVKNTTSTGVLSSSNYYFSFCSCYNFLLSN